jgi:hypothetical protein
MFRSLALIGAMSFAMPAHATSYLLDFDPDLACVSTCLNGSSILQSYGDIPGQLDVIYDASRGTDGLQPMQYWGTGYESLQGVAYGLLNAGGLSITLSVFSGFDIALQGFDIAPYLNRSQNTSIEVIDIEDGAVVLQQAFNPLSTADVTNFAFSGSQFTSSFGFVINLGPDAWNVGIDNIAFSVTPTRTQPPPYQPVVPLPAAGWMLLAGLGGLAALRRRAGRA